MQNEEVLYIYIGGKGINGNSEIAVAGGYNGGGTALGNSDSNNGSGGGATDIRYNGETLNDRIMVAGGGGGSVITGSNVYGAGGGLISNTTNTGASVGTFSAYGATQFNGGYGNSNSVSGAFGLGGAGGSTYSAGGGGGYYGGGVAMYASSGGSSYISGYAGVNSIYELSQTTGLINSSEPREHTNNTIHYSGKYFIDGKMESGVNEGNGKAKITYLGTDAPERINTKLNDVKYIKDCMTGNTTNGIGHWNEIQAIVEGVNVANGVVPLGTISQTDNVTYPYIKATDGDIITYGYTSNDIQGDEKCLIVTLDNEYDLDEIAVWHYWDDGRTYSDNITSVAGENGVYRDVVMNETAPETSQGKRVNAYSTYDLGYASDNILLLYDGIINNGFTSSHTTSTSIWKNLVNNNYTGSLIGATWESNNLVLNGTTGGISLGNYFNDLFKDDNTIEIVLKRNQIGVRDIILGNHSVANSINYEFRADNKARIYFKAGSFDASTSMTFPNNEIMLLSFVFDKANSKIYFYKNGELIQTFSNALFNSYSFDWSSAYIGRDSRDTDVSLSGNIYSVRIYGRVLNDLEITQNYLIDKSRFDF